MTDNEKKLLLIDNDTSQWFDVIIVITVFSET